MQRREFLAAAGSFAAATLIPSRRAVAETAAKKIRVGVIGHSGRGNYGHGLDTVWLDLPETEIIAVADADPAGLKAALAKLKVTEGFSDYRAMLAAAKPDVVAVGPRHVDQHADMIVAAIEAGARGVYVEKPFCRTPAEADRILAACASSGAKVAVAHRNRYHPALAAIDKLIADGGIGKVLELRGRGKGDKRGGSEDLWVLGSHVLNLIAYFGGAPRSCSAVVKQNGELVTKAHVKEGPEGIGPLAGNEVHARYEMERGPIAYFDSMADDGTRSEGFGLRIVGGDGVIDLKCDKLPLAHLYRGNPLAVSARPQAWVPIGSAGPDVPEPRTDLGDYVGHHVGPCRDLIACLGTDREPLCGAKDGATTVEMISAVFESHRQQSAAVTFPLKERGNPLSLFR
jgi:predicted dehydrogenase